MSTKLIACVAALAVSLFVVPASAADVCKGGPKPQWKKPDEAKQAVLTAGYKNVTKMSIEDGCYEALAQTSDGKKIEVLLDPITLQVVKTEDPE